MKKIVLFFTIFCLINTTVSAQSVMEEWLKNNPTKGFTNKGIEAGGTVEGNFYMTESPIVEDARDHTVLSGVPGIFGESTITVYVIIDGKAKEVQAVVISNLHTSLKWQGLFNKPGPDLVAYQSGNQVSYSYTKPRSFRGFRKNVTDANGNGTKNFTYSVQF